MDDVSDVAQFVILFFLHGDSPFSDLVYIKSASEREYFKNESNLNLGKITGEYGQAKDGACGFGLADIW
jgi:hypothetical protein